MNCYQSFGLVDLVSCTTQWFVMHCPIADILQVLPGESARKVVDERHDANITKPCKTWRSCRTLVFQPYYDIP